METIFDLPAHPLFVHTPVVLAPLMCLAAIALALQPRWRGPYRWHLLVGVTVVLVTTQLAIASGEKFDEALGGAPIDKHQDLAETTRLWLVLWFVITAVTVAHGLWVSRQDDNSSSPLVARALPAQHVLAAVGALVAVVSTIWMFRTGHEGALIVWKGTV